MRPMKVFESSVSPKGQITIPLEVRRRFGIKPKDKVAIRVEDDQVTLAPATSALDAGFQSIPALSPRRSWEEVTELAADDHAQQAAREGLPHR